MGVSGQAGSQSWQGRWEKEHWAVAKCWRLVPVLRHRQGRLAPHLSPLHPGLPGKEDSTLQAAQTQPASHCSVFCPCQAQTNPSVWRRMCPAACVAG